MKKIIFGFLILSVLIALSIYNGFFTPYNYLTAKQDIKNQKIQIIIIGEISHKNDQQQILAKKFGFCFNYIGCITSPGLINGTIQYNNIMIEHLAQKHGKDWGKFQSKTDTIKKSY